VGLLILLTGIGLYALARTTSAFAVDRVAQYAKDEFPAGSVYGDIDEAGLRLITCGGDFDSSADSYRDNVVVYASLVA